jgi:putative FmdB family regulatory protein
MPRYEYRCRACGDTFEKTRPMSEASAPIDCPGGHPDTVKLFSMVSVGALAKSTGRSAGGPAPAPESGGGGGCCGGGCCS